MSSYIEVKNVSKSFGGKAILQDVSLSIEQGTTVGLVGANGSGKSVLFKILCGFEKPDRGSVYVRGKQLGKNGRDFPESLGVFINSPGFIGIYSGFQNLKFLADIQGKIGEKEIRQAMGKVGLDPDNKTKVDNYSLGMKQKLGIAQAIMEGQDILILDEPFNALDYKTYEDVKAIIRMLKAEGKTIFLTSHHFKDIEQLCDQVYSIEDCRLIPITEEIAARYREMIPILPVRPATSFRASSKVSAEATAASIAIIRLLNSCCLALTCEINSSTIGTYCSIMWIRFCSCVRR